MAVTGLLNLAENLLNVATARPNQATQSNVNTNNSAAATIQDEFTSSTQNLEQAAGLFTVNQFSLFSTAAETLLAPATNTTLANPAAANTLNADASGAFAATGANSQQQLQTLNSALDGLGLSNANISKIDRIANVTNDFNPEAFSILAHQLLAQQVPQDTAATTTAPAQTKSAKA